jgi:hypothetical protein
MPKDIVQVGPLQRGRIRTLRPELFIGMADTTSNAGQRRNFPPLALLIIIPVRPKAMEVRKTTINSVVHMA